MISLHQNSKIIIIIIIIIIISLEWPCPVRLSIFDVCFYRAFILLLFVESCFISAEKLSLVCCTRWFRYFVLSCSGLIVLIAAASPCFVTRPLTVS